MAWTVGYDFNPCQSRHHSALHNSGLNTRLRHAHTSFLTMKSNKSSFRVNNPLSTERKLAKLEYVCYMPNNGEPNSRFTGGIECISIHIASLCCKTKIIALAYILSHTPLCISIISGVCVQGMWNAQVKGQVTETHRLKFNSHCDTALFISMYDITMVQP